MNRKDLEALEEMATQQLLVLLPPGPMKNGCLRQPVGVGDPHAHDNDTLIARVVCRPVADRPVPRSRTPTKQLRGFFFDCGEPQAHGDLEVLAV